MPLVTTIIPAFNASRTIAETIGSALAQTHAEHEIVVVDDGSTDATRAIVSAIAQRHPNICIVGQENRGLASARNAGIAAARGDYIAPLDADDLWHPEKLARQLAAIDARPSAALAYGWFRNIDPHNRVLPGSGAPVAEGWVYHRHLDQNFISNGSAPLVRTDVAREIGYDPTLSRGCEDYMFQLQVARRYQFACVRGWLMGYRRTPGSMSTGVLRMIDAHLQMYALLLPDADPDARAIIARQVARLQVERARNRWRRGLLGEGADALGRAIATDPAAAAGAIGAQLRLALERARKGMFPSPARPFSDYALDEPDGTWFSGRSPARDAALAELDARIGPVG
ncbi:MAG: glycosyltransferase family 2 protein [Sphingobium sp.]|nr:glycosyltransferase family 2 protein [Sphingobium sp.]